MASFGTRLKQEREQRGISLDEISRSTKIGTRLLRALEDEHLEELPGGIFNKGFIRAYARALGMDENQVIADYVAATTTPPLDGQPPIRDTPLPQVPPKERKQGGRLPWGSFAVVLLLAACALIIWSFYTQPSQPAAPAKPATQTVPANAAPNVVVTKPSIEEPQPAPKDTPIQNGVPETPKTNLTNANPEPKTPPNPAPPTPSTEQPKPTGTGGKPFRVLIKAREDSWVTITVDGEVTIQRTLSASAQNTIEAQHELIIKAGNVGGLDFAFNGQKLPPQGEDGEVKTLVFDAKGLHSSPAAVPLGVPAQP